MGGIEPNKKEGNIWIYEDEKTRIAINRKWCKACEICVEFCPKNVLAMENDKAVVVDLGACSRCLLCEIRCPDFAIEVFDLAPKTRKAKASEQAGVDAGFLNDTKESLAGDLEGPDMCYDAKTAANDITENYILNKTEGKGPKKG